MAGADINSLTRSPNLRLVAVADVDLARTAEIRRRFPQLPLVEDEGLDVPAFLALVAAAKSRIV